MLVFGHDDVLVVTIKIVHYLIIFVLSVSLFFSSTLFLCVALLMTGCTATAYIADASATGVSVRDDATVIDKNGDTLLFEKYGLESYNRDVFAFNEVLDRNIYRPVALSYQRYVPAFFRIAIGNILSNINEIDIAVNNILQLKLLDAGSDILRFLINSTIGILGIFDVATPMGLEKHNEDFGQTLGYWGVGEGYYVLFPVFPLGMTLRDWTGFMVDMNYLDHDFLSLNTDTKTTLTILGFVNLRAGLLNREGGIIGDRYSFIKNSYLQNRRFLVRDGQLTEEDAFLDDQLDYEDLERFE